MEGVAGDIAERLCSFVPTLSPVSKLPSDHPSFPVQPALCSLSSICFFLSDVDI